MLLFSWSEKLLPSFFFIFLYSLNWNSFYKSFHVVGAQGTPGQAGGTFKSLCATSQLLWLEQSSPGLLNRSDCLSQGSVRESLLHNVVSWFVHELGLEELLSEAWDLGVGEGLKISCVGIPYNLLSLLSWFCEKHVAKLTVVGFNRKGFLGFLRGSLCSLKSGINKSKCLWAAEVPSVILP